MFQKLNNQDGQRQAESSVLKDRKLFGRYIKEKGLGAIQGRRIGFVDISRPLDGLDKENENDPGYEVESSEMTME